MNLLSRLFLILGVVLLLGSCSQYSAVVERPTSAAAQTREQKEFLKSVERTSDSPLEEIGRFLDAADAARLALAETPDDPGAQSDYSFAVARVVELIREQKLHPWEKPFTCYSGGSDPWTVTARDIDPRPGRRFADFHFLPADQYIAKGKREGGRTIKPGVGAPVVVATSQGDFKAIDPTAPTKKSFLGMTAILNFEGKNCELVLVDPRKNETAEINGREYPLAADFQAPLALGFAQLEPDKKIGRRFKPDQLEQTARLGQLRPYDPEKIPVLFVHGLGNSVRTWMPLIEYLRDDARIRDHYQFIFYSWPSTLPYPISAAMLRKELDDFRKRYPRHKDFVVIGHSMGGQISRMLMQDSGMKLWDALYEKPPAEMPFSAPTREAMTETLIFKSRNDIARTIFVSASHRGSEEATSFLGRVGAKLLGTPVAANEITTEALAHARRDIDPTGERTTQRNRLPNAIDVLDPESPFLQIANSLPMRKDIPFHSIMGDRGKGGNLSREKPVSTDGVVPYWSSHLDGAVSEKIVPSGHWSHLSDGGEAEIRRILHYHLAAGN